MLSSSQWTMRSMFPARLALVLIVCVQLDTRAEGFPGDARLEEMSKVVASRPEDIGAGNDLRRICRERKMQERCIEFFDALAKKHPLAAATRYNAALAQIDNLPGHSLLSQARMSTNSIEHASAVLEHAPNDWLALYIRGLNNLYWPTWYRRTDRAIADLSRCTQMSESLPPERRKSYMALAHVALGDAYVKAGKIEQARDVWRRGLDAHASPDLTKRLAISEDVLPETIEQMRSREVSVDTNIEFYVGAGQG